MGSLGDIRAVRALTAPGQLGLDDPDLVELQTK